MSDEKIVVHPVDDIYMECSICHRLIPKDITTVFCMIAPDMMGQLKIAYRFYCAECLEPKTAGYIH